jgi:hypothetical protein
MKQILDIEKSFDKERKQIRLEKKKKEEQESIINKNLKTMKLIERSYNS